MLASGLALAVGAGVLSLGRRRRSRRRHLGRARA